MSTTISPQNEKFLAQQVANGTYRDRGEALDAAVELLRLREQLLERIDEGRRQLDSGDFVEHDDDSLREFFAELKQRTAEHASAARNES